MDRTKMFTITRTATYTGFAIIVITGGTRRTIQITTGTAVFILLMLHVALLMEKLRLKR